MAQTPDGYVKLIDIPGAELTFEQRETLMCRALHELAIVMQMMLTRDRGASERYVARGGIIRVGADGEPVIPVSAAGEPWSPELAEADGQAAEPEPTLADALKASLTAARKKPDPEPTPDPAQDEPAR